MRDLLPFFPAFGTYQNWKDSMKMLGCPIFASSRAGEAIELPQTLGLASHGSPMKKLAS